MSEQLIVLNKNQALAAGGIGFSAPMFKAKPGFLELVHKSSRQPNVQYGQFRDTSTNEHFGTSIRVVLLSVPQEAREYWVGDEFTKNEKQCFSMDNVQPHRRAPKPPAMYCAQCPLGDIMWSTWRKTKRKEDLPKCQMQYNLLLAMRTTQRAYYMNVKGTSVAPFKRAMEVQMAGTLANLFAKAKADNKARGYTYVSAENKFIATPGVQQQQPALPLPNLFDLSFEIYSESKSGGPFVMGFKDFKLMSPEDQAEFGQLYVDLQKRKQDITQAYAEEAEANTAVTEASAEGNPKVVQETLPPIVI